MKVVRARDIGILLCSGSVQEYRHALFHRFFPSVAIINTPAVLVVFQNFNSRYLHNARVTGGLHGTFPSYYRGINAAMCNSSSPFSLYYYYFFLFQKSARVTR